MEACRGVVQLREWHHDRGDVPSGICVVDMVYGVPVSVKEVRQIVDVYDLQMGVWGDVRGGCQAAQSEKVWRMWWIDGEARRRTAASHRANTKIAQLIIFQSGSLIRHIM